MRICRTDDRGWFGLGGRAVIVAYIAHPLGAGPDRDLNRRNAQRWAAWLAEKFDVAPIVDWSVLAGFWPETPEMRDRGLTIDVALVARADEVWMVGGRVSPGMRIEADAALKLGKPVRDLTRVVAPWANTFSVSPQWWARRHAFECLGKEWLP